MSVVNALNSLKLPWILLLGLIIGWLLAVLWKVISARVSDKPSTPWLQVFVTALNLISTPWLALVVIVLGMTFDIYSKIYGLAPDGANQIIGAGIGLLTGQGAAAASHALQQLQEKQPPLPTNAPTTQGPEAGK